MILMIKKLFADVHQHVYHPHLLILQLLYALNRIVNGIAKHGV